jgi:hypothetical protein
MPSLGKESPPKYLSELAGFYSELDLQSLTVRRPSKFIFICGGVMRPKPKGNFASLREFLCTNSDKLSCRLVRAEAARDLFTYSSYNDLVEFEAHVAQIAELVLLICESSGSLAELGSFYSSKDISKRIYVVLRQLHYEAASFVMLGPVRHLVRRRGEDVVGAFDWPLPKRNYLRREQLQPLSPALEQAINRRLKRNEGEHFRLANESHRILLIYWLCFVLRGPTLSELLQANQLLGLNLSEKKISKFLYCMRVADWIRVVNVGVPYYVPYHDRDPFDYAFKKRGKQNFGRAQRIKADIAQLIKHEYARPIQVEEMLGGGTRGQIEL